MLRVLPYEASWVLRAPLLRVRVGITMGLEGVAAGAEDIHVGFPLPSALSFLLDGFRTWSRALTGTTSFSLSTHDFREGDV